MSKYIQPTTVVDTDAFRPYGIQSRIVTEDGDEIHDTWFDAEPHMVRAALLRESQGNQWGDGKIIANLSMAQYLSLKQQGIIGDPVRFRQWLRDNKAFCGFERALL